MPLVELCHFAVPAVEEQERSRYVACMRPSNTLPEPALALVFASTRLSLMLRAVVLCLLLCLTCRHQSANTGAVLGGVLHSLLGPVHQLLLALQHNHEDHLHWAVGIHCVRGRGTQLVAPRWVLTRVDERAAGVVGRVSHCQVLDPHEGAVQNELRL